MGSSTMPVPPRHQQRVQQASQPLPAHPGGLVLFQDAVNIVVAPPADEAPHIGPELADRVGSGRVGGCGGPGDSEAVPAVKLVMPGVELRHLTCLPKQALAAPPAQPAADMVPWGGHGQATARPPPLRPQSPSADIPQYWVVTATQARSINTTCCMAALSQAVRSTSGCMAQRGSAISPSRPRRAAGSIVLRGEGVFVAGTHASECKMAEIDCVGVTSLVGWSVRGGGATVSCGRQAGRHKRAAPAAHPPQRLHSLRLVMPLSDSVQAVAQPPPVRAGMRKASAPT